MSLFEELNTFKRELQAMNRKLDQVISLLKMLVEMQAKAEEEGDSGPESS